MHTLFLTISQSTGLSAVQFLTLNVAMLIGLCSLYTAFLFFLHKKRIRTGRYDSIPPHG